MKVKDIMTTQIACVSSEETIERAAQLMKQYNVGSVPVCDGDKVIGIITDRDIALRHVAENGGTGQQTVSDVMTSNPVVGSPDMEAKDAARLMGERQIRRLPIVQSGTLVGIVALGDLSVEPALKGNAGNALNDISKQTGMT